MQDKEKLTGYPSIDRPWLKYYTEEAINTPLPDCTIYEHLLENNKDHLNETALIYFGKKITYHEFFLKISRTASALCALGINKGDIVTIQALSLPQVIYLLYALNKIGAIANLIYVTLNQEEVEANLKETKSKLYITIDSIYYKFSSEFQSKYLNTTVLLSVDDEMDFASKTVFRLKSRHGKTGRSGRALSWKLFLSGSHGNESPTVGNADDIAVIVYTGGTTGKSKGVLLTNRNLNASAWQYYCLGFERGHRFLSVLPPFIAFGVVVSLHMPLLYGLTACLGVGDPLKISQFVIKYKPNYLICGTVQAEKMIPDLDRANIDLSNLICFSVGGDTVTPALENKLNSFLARHNSAIQVAQGYAMSETSAAMVASTYTPFKQIHKKYTTGVPLVNTTVKIVDDGNNEVGYNEQGEICILSPCIMKEYYENAEETDNIIRVHADHKKWLHTGDIGTIDEDGFISVVGRIKRMILTVQNGVCLKVYPKILEDEYRTLSVVEAISIVGRPSGNGVSDLIAFVVFKEGTDIEAAKKTLKDFAEKHFEKYEIPVEFRSLPALPLTTIGKVDYRALEQIVNEK